MNTVICCQIYLFEPVKIYSLWVKITLLLSYPRKRESIIFRTLWMTAFAGMTYKITLNEYRLERDERDGYSIHTIPEHESYSIIGQDFIIGVIASVLIMDRSRFYYAKLHFLFLSYQNAERVKRHVWYITIDNYVIITIVDSMKLFQSRIITF